MIESIPRFLQGAFEFEGYGLMDPRPLARDQWYTVPSDRRAQLVYLRAGNSSDELVYLLLTRDGVAMRYFPIGARSAMHVPLVVLEDIEPDATIELLIAAPKGVSGTLVVDLGLHEI